MRISDRVQQLADLGAKPPHIGRILRAWTQGLPLDTGTRRQQAENFLPLGVRKGLPAVAERIEGLACLASEHPGQDGSARLLVKLADGQLVESVLLPREGLCVSSQVGCAVGCTFCMTGKSGLLRQVGSAEIVAQVALARRVRPVKKVVGHGRAGAQPGQRARGHRPAGYRGRHRSPQPGVFHRGRSPGVRAPAAAAGQAGAGFVAAYTDAALRAQLLPRAPRYDPAELIAQGEAYARRIGYPIQYQWTLLAGINDSQAEMDEVLRLLKGKYGVLNLIPYNSLGRFPAPERRAHRADRALPA